MADTEHKLTPDVVFDIADYCTSDLPAAASKAVDIQGIVNEFRFNPSRIEERRDRIAELLSELPDQFHQDTGGGWSFLNACNDRQGRLWTGEHRTMEVLVCLGIACGLVTFTFPRNMWGMLPGRVPYLMVKREARNA